MNYGELKTFLDSMAHRTDLSSLYDNFTEMAEARIGRKLKSIEQEVTETVSTTDEVYDLTGLTGSFGSLMSIYLNANSQRVPLKYYSKEQLDNLTSGVSYNAVGYTIQSNKLEVRPTNGNQSITLTYFARPATLVGADANVNDVLTNFPQVYVSAMLYEIASYERDRDQQALTMNDFNNEVRDVNQDAEDARNSGGTMAGIGGNS